MGIRACEAFFRVHLRLYGFCLVIPHGLRIGALWPIDDVLSRKVNRSFWGGCDFFFFGIAGSFHS